MEKVIKIINVYHTPDYEERIDRIGYAGNTCECCGRRLNPKTMKGLQMLETGHWTDETAEVKECKSEGWGRSQGWFYIGPECYKQIRAKLAASTETMIVEI